MTVPDDSALLHYSEGYDPQKAREYYLRNRKLKGRKRGRQETPAPRRERSTPELKVKTRTGAYTPTTRDKPTASRQEILENQREALMRRLDRLKAILAEKVKAAQARSGVETKEEKTESEKTPSEKAKSKKSSKESEGSDKPLTQKQKREKAEKAKEKYEEENGPVEKKEDKDSALDKEIEELKRQIEDIQSRIQKAIDDARELVSKKETSSTPKTASTAKSSRPIKPKPKTRPKPKPKTASKGR